jgi:nitroreductase
MPGFDLFEAIYTQRAIRDFKTDPVPDELVHEVLDAAIRAPSGGNSQQWSFLVLKDPEVRRQVAAIYKRAWDEGGMARFSNDPDRSRAHVYSTATYLAEHMSEVPVLIMACIRRGRSGPSFGLGSSIYPAVQNLMLAARALGLGTVITTAYKPYEAEIKGLLGIPEDVETAALIPLGYPGDRARFGGNRRKPVEEVTYRDRWGQAWP